MFDSRKEKQEVNCQFVKLSKAKAGGAGGAFVEVAQNYKKS